MLCPYSNLEICSSTQERLLMDTPVFICLALWPGVVCYTPTDCRSLTMNAAISARRVA
jgi:hypothetical protein